MGIPLGAYGPVRYTRRGTNIVLSWAGASDQAPNATTAARATLKMTRSFMSTSLSVMVTCGRPRSPSSASTASSVREGPHAELLLGDLPESRQSTRLDDQKENDEATEHHQLDLLLERRRHPEAQPVGNVREQNRRE